VVRVRCAHLVVEYSRETYDIDGREVIAHKFPCTHCDASVLIWDDDVNYEDIK